MSNRIFQFSLIALVFTGCVSARQLDDVKVQKAELEALNDDISRKNENLLTENNELSAEVRNQNERIDEIEGEKAKTEETLRALQEKYDKLNELNELIENKSTTLLGNAADENRILLAELEQTRLELQKKEDSLDELETTLNVKEKSLNELSSELESRSQRLAELESLLAEKDATANALKEKVQKALLGFENQGLTIVEKDGKVYVSLEANLLFPSGSTKINEEGKGALMKLAKAIESQEDLEIVVEGHTDTDKLRSNSTPGDNWELSVLRSTSVVKLMMENSSINPKILSASGRSEYHPIDPNDKAKNRRIEIILAPDLTELYNIID